VTHSDAAAAHGPALDQAADSPLPSPTVRGDGLLWLTVAVLLLLLYALFRTFVVREIAWAYPANYDQTKYLGYSYSFYEAVLQKGMVRGLRELFSTPFSNGMLIHLQAVGVMLVGGAGRLTALSVNFATLAVYLVVISGVVRQLTGTRRLAILAFALALGTGPFWFGYQTDYRLDFTSMCILGIFVSLAMGSRVFRSTGWSAVTGVAAALLVVSRFLTALYVAGIYAGMLAYFALIYPAVLKRIPGTALRNVALSAAIGAVLSVPLVWVSRQAIYDYYVVQTRLEASVRLAEFSVDGLLGHWLYYPKSLLLDHVGLPLVVAAVFVLLIALVARWTHGAAGTHGASRLPDWYWDAWVFVGVGLLVILGTLTMNIVRSPVVGGVAVPLFTWAVLLAVLPLLQPRLQPGTPLFARAAALAAACALMLTMAAQVRFFGRHYIFWHNRADVQEIARMYEAIGGYADEAGLTQAVVAADSIRDYLLGPAVTATHYERTGRLIAFNSALGASGSVMAPPREALLAALNSADFLVLTHRNDAAEPPYPLVAALDQMRADFDAASAKLLPLGEFVIFGRVVHLFARPVARVVSGVSGGWVTADGLVVEVAAPRRAKSEADVVFTGGMNPWIARDLSAACVPSGDAADPEAPGSFIADQLVYVARCPLPSDDDGDGRVRVRLRFSRFFVPREIGLNDDPRRLVVSAPAKIDVLPRQPVR
jgi:hypothetical protein